MIVKSIDGSIIANLRRSISRTGIASDQKVYFSKSLSHIGGEPLALCLRLAAGFMLGPSFWVFLPKLLHQPVVKISILCRVILMDPTRPPVVCHLTVECSTFEVEVEAGGRVSAQSRTIPITQRCPNYSRHFAPALPVQSSNVKCRNRQNFQKTSPTLALAIPHIYFTWIINTQKLICATTITTGRRVLFPSPQRVRKGSEQSLHREYLYKHKFS